MAAILHQVLNDEPKPPRRLDAALPADLETICLTALAKEPARRYFSAAQMAEDLRRWLRGEPIRARPLGQLGRAWLWARRHPGSALLSTSVAGLLLALAVGSTASAVLIARARSLADVRRQQAEASARAAGEQRTLALETVNILVQKAQQLLADRPGTLELRRQLAEEALLKLQKIAESADASADSDHSWITTHLRLGDIFHLLGRTAEARGQYERARDLANERRDLAAAHEGLARTRREMGDLPGAEASAREALQLRQALADEAPEDDARMRELASCHRTQGETHLTGAPHKAVSHYERAVRLLTPLVTRDDSTHALQAELCSLHQRLGTAYAFLYDFEQATRHLDEARALALRLTTADPKNAAWQRSLMLRIADEITSVPKGPVARFFFRWHGFRIVYPWSP